MRNERPDHLHIRGKGHHHYEMSGGRQNTAGLNLGFGMFRPWLAANHSLASPKEGAFSDGTCLDCTSCSVHHLVSFTNSLASGSGLVERTPKKWEFNSMDIHTFSGVHSTNPLPEASGLVKLTSTTRLIICSDRLGQTQNFLPHKMRPMDESGLGSIPQKKAEKSV